MYYRRSAVRRVEMSAKSGSGEIIGSLTGVRGVAAFWVALFHARGMVFSDLALPQMMENLVLKGWIAVDLFFVLSGFIMSHVHQTDFSRLTALPVWRFLKLRLVRIYPAHLVAALLWLPAIGLGVWLAPGSLSEGVSSNFNLRTFLFAIGLMNGWGFPHSQGWNLPSWSVGSEWFAYLCFPLIARWLISFRSAWHHIVLAIFTVLACGALAMLVNGGTQYMLPESCTLIRVVSEFMIGCCGYGLYRNLRASALNVWIAPAAMLVSLVLASVRVQPIFDGAYILLFAVLIVGLTVQGSMPARILASPMLTYLGRVSYSVYLTHGLVIICLRQLISRIHEPGALMWIALIAAYLVGITIAGDLLHRTVEEPCRRYLRSRWVR
jgi:peptidoglycan/LPS O-acetylase OafA/YrhL